MDMENDTLTDIASGRIFKLKPLGEVRKHKKRHPYSDPPLIALLHLRIAGIAVCDEPKQKWDENHPYSDTLDACPCIAGGTCD